MRDIQVAERVLKAIHDAGIGVVSVSIGVEEDRATWRVHPSFLQTQAQPVIDAFTIPTPATLFDQFAEQRIGEKALLATAQALWECIPAPTMTKAQMKTRAKAIFKTL